MALRDKQGRWVVPGVAGDGSRQQSSPQSHQQSSPSPHQESHQHLHEFADDLADEFADDFGSRKSLVRNGTAGHPPPAEVGEIQGEAASDPSLPTT